MPDLRSKIKRWVASPWERKPAAERMRPREPGGKGSGELTTPVPSRKRGPKEFGLRLSVRRPRLCASADPDIRRRISGTARSMLPNRSWEMRVSVDAQADMLSAEASSAMCVQKFDDSRTVCRSHYVSHLAAFFIVARAKISVVESYQFGSASAKSVSSRAAYSASVCVVCLECVGVCEGGRGKRARYIYISLAPLGAPQDDTNSRE